MISQIVCTPFSCPKKENQQIIMDVLFNRDNIVRPKMSVSKEGLDREKYVHLRQYIKGCFRVIFILVPL